MNDEAKISLSVWLFGEEKYTGVYERWDSGIDTNFNPLRYSQPWWSDARQMAVISGIGSIVDYVDFSKGSLVQLTFHEFEEFAPSRIYKDWKRSALTQ